jgi:hypothetical protein
MMTERPAETPAFFVCAILFESWRGTAWPDIVRGIAAAVKIRDC